MDTFPSRLKRFRKKAKLSQAGLAKLCKKAGPSWVGNIESGERNMGSDDIPIVAGVLHVHPGELFADLPSSRDVRYSGETLQLALQLARQSIELRGMNDFDPEHEPLDAQILAAAIERVVSENISEISDTNIINFMRSMRKKDGREPDRQAV